MRACLSRCGWGVSGSVVVVVVVVGWWMVCLCVFVCVWFEVCGWCVGGGGGYGCVVCGVWRFRIVPIADCVVRKAQSGGECGWSGTSAK